MRKRCASTSSGSHSKGLLGWGYSLDPRSGQASAAWVPGNASRWDHGGPRRGGFRKVHAQCASPGRQSSGIRVKRSQIRRINLREGVRWRHTPWLGRQFRSGFVGRRPLPVCRNTQPPNGSTTVCTDETLASSSPHLPPIAQLVCHWAPHQSAAGLQSRPREDPGL